MAFNPQQYNSQYLANIKAGGAPINDAAAKYGVRIVEANVAEGDTYWRVIGVHHLLPLENVSNHHLYLEALDEQGSRIKSPPVWVGWTWEGRRPDEAAPPVALDKPDTEAAGNIMMYFGQKVAAWVNGSAPNAQDKSDRVENVHTTHPDEPSPDGLFNTLGHHSFYVVFQRTRKGEVTPPPVIPPVEPPPVVEPPVTPSAKYKIKSITRSFGLPLIIFFGVADGLHGKLVAPDGKVIREFITGNKPEHGAGGTEGGYADSLDNYILFIGDDKFIIPMTGGSAKIEFEAVAATDPLVFLKSELMSRKRAQEVLEFIENIAEFEGLFRIE